MHRPAQDGGGWTGPDRLEQAHARIQRLGAPALSPLRRGAVVGAALALPTVPPVLLLAPGASAPLG